MGGDNKTQLPTVLEESLKERYAAQQDRREKLYSSASILLTLLGFVYASLAYVLRNLPHLCLASNLGMDGDYVSLVFVFFGLAVVYTVYLSFLIFRVMTRYQYVDIPTPDDLSRYYRVTLVPHYLAKKRPNFGDDPNAMFRRYYFQLLISICTHNQIVNDRRTTWRQKSFEVLAIVTVGLAIDVLMIELPKKLGMEFLLNCGN